MLNCFVPRERKPLEEPEDALLYVIDVTHTRCGLSAIFVSKEASRERAATFQNAQPCGVTELLTNSCLQQRTVLGYGWESTCLLPFQP